MDITTPGRSRRLLRLALGGVGLALGWVLMSLMLGLSSSSALADDTEERGGVLGAVGTVVSGGAALVDGAADTVTDVAGGTVGAVGKVADQSVASAPAPAVVQPVAAVVSGAAGAVGDVVQQVAEERPVSQIVEVVTTVVEHTPVVGAVADEIGLPAAAGTIGGAVDDAVGSVGGTVTDVADAVDPAPDSGGGAGSGPGSIGPFVPPSDESSSVDAGGPLGAVADSVGSSTVVLDRLAAARSVLRAHADTGLVSTRPLAIPAPASADAIGTAWGGPSGSIGVLLPVDAVSGPSGAGLGAWGLLAVGPLFAYRAWVRSRGPDDDRLPGAPIFGTDVSPD
jgi:hypothetical protein